MSLNKRLQNASKHVKDAASNSPIEIGLGSSIKIPIISTLILTDYLFNSNGLEFRGAFSTQWEYLNINKKYRPDILASADNIPVEDEKYDCVVCFELLEHVSDPIKVINESYRILKPGGINIYTVRHTYDGDYKKGIHRGEDMYENDGFIVHFFSKNKINSLLGGFRNLEITSFEEGSFPRKLYFVANKKL